MAYLAVTHVRCKNKLCTYEGIIRHYGHEEPQLVCPACGFKTLSVYNPFFENMRKELKL